MLLLFALIVGLGSSWAETVKLTNGNIVAAGSGETGYKTWTLKDENNNSWSAYAIKNQHSNATSSYHFLQIKKYTNNTAYYVEIPALGAKITSIKMTVSSTQKPMTDGGNTATLFFSSSNSTSEVGTGVASGTGASSVTIDCSDLNLNTGYITASAGVRIWDVEVTYSTEEQSNLETSDFELSDTPVSLNFDLYNNSGAQTISYTTSSTGAVTVSESDYVTITVDESNKKITVTPIAVTPSAQTITVRQAADETYAAGSATFTVSITAKHAVKFSVNGVITTTDEVNEGAAIVFPGTPADIAGKSFVGWTKTAIGGTTNEVPELVTSATMGTEDVTYYAVFANVTEGNHKDVVDEITASDLAATGTSSYADFSGVKITSDAEYAGNSAKDSDGNIQMRSKNSSSGIVSTTSGGRLKSVIITVGSGSNTIDVYGSNTAYTSAGDLYGNSNQGTKLGSVSKTGTITVTGNYDYVGIRSNNGAIYLSSIEITWETGTPDTYSDYCTTVPAPESVSATIASSGYTTFCSPFDLSFENVTGLEAAYVVTTSTASSATLKKVTAVPAGTGVILKGTTGAVTIPVAEYTGEAISNILVGTLTATPVETETVYVVSGGEFKLFAGTEIPAGKAYLPASAIGSNGGNAPSLSFDFGGETTGLSEELRVNSKESIYYDLSGRRVAQPTKGLYIVNGKKVLVP